MRIIQPFCCYRQIYLFNILNIAVRLIQSGVRAYSTLNAKLTYSRRDALLLVIMSHDKHGVYLVTSPFLNIVLPRARFERYRSPTRAHG